MKVLAIQNQTCLLEPNIMDLIKFLLVSLRDKKVLLAKNKFFLELVCKTQLKCTIKFIIQFQYPIKLIQISKVFSLP
jgi:hypothetical protein